MHHLSEKSQRVIARLVQRRPDLGACVSDLALAAGMILKAQRDGGRLLVCGNGGSASDALHIVGELVKGFEAKRPLSAAQKSALAAVHPEYGSFLQDKLQGAMRAVSLVGETALMTAIANDTSADVLFAQQVLGQGAPGDVLLGITTSGNSKNVLYAMVTAKAQGLKTIALAGPSGGKIKELADCCIRAPGANTPEIQESHLPLYHTLCLILENELFKE